MWFWLIISVILGAFGQIFMSVAMKAGGGVPRFSEPGKVLSYYIDSILSLPMLGAVSCYGVSVILWLAILSQKDLSLARPLMSIGYLVTLAWGFYIGENVTWGRVIGTLLIIIGIYFVIASDLTKETQSSGRESGFIAFLNKKAGK